MGITIMGVLAVVLGLLAFAGFMLLRNNHVCNYGLWVLRNPSISPQERLRCYDRLPDYGVMLWQLWRWDWNDYLHPDTMRDIPEKPDSGSFALCVVDGRLRWIPVAGCDAVQEQEGEAT